jgi:hypothetical protein
MNRPRHQAHRETTSEEKKYEAKEMTETEKPKCNGIEGETNYK